MRARFQQLLFLAGFAAAALHAQQPSNPDDAEKRRQFLKAREEMRTLPLTPSPETPPKPKPKPRSNPTPAPESTPRPKPATPEPESTPRPKPATPKPATAKPATPEPATPAPPKPESTPRPKPATPTPQTTPRPSTVRPASPPPVTPAPVTPAPASPIPQADVTITKREVQNELPAPPAGWWTRWKYLSRSVRADIDRARVVRNRWRYIVVHNSGTRQGSAKAFEHYHRYVRKMVNGMAYQFVVGNGSSTGDGEIEVGNRWRLQLQGGHVHSDFLNNIALGICLVGDFNRDVPTSRQLASLEELIRYLRQRVGRVDGKWSIVKPHREINPPRWPTDCPGDRFPARWLHSKFD